MKNDLDQQYIESKYDGTPQYYAHSQGDLYDTFINQFGLDQWMRHVEMEAVQYIVRAHKKGHYLDDIRKAAVILERLVYEVTERTK